ncbi:response regulator [Microseira wollei]|uniref:Response regulator receiver modulated diguanylate cyclase/phosphodiesterase n=1 Tax=Microseira wollei NIES-4236 TaxID=2530354 RepID=A0AAV3XAL3_9CYAN|nr:response regulator [Microseira wollei]GET39902.1 response regulator receiver modulated diguanylate cyclase/phosphodiesterase [Microseira wollei NIES-4236]
MMTLLAHNTPTTPIKVLIVEDEPIVAENVARNLKQQGYEVAGLAKTGEDAILAAGATHPDIVLMDIMLKGEIDGVEAARQIRHQWGIPIIYMTAYADKTTLARAKQTEPYGYLVKPFKPQDMWTTIEIAIKRHQVDKAMIARHAAQLQFIQEYMEQLVGYASFTQLPHRLSLQNEFERIVNSIPPLKNINGKTRNIPSLFAPVFCLRLDRLQRLSNSLGCEKSDLLLKLVAQRLTSHLGRCGVLARLNADDEFAILLDPGACKTEVSNAAQQLLEVFSQPFLLYQQEIFLTASIGIAIYSRDGFHLEQLLTKSKKAMNYAQQKGGNRYEFYTALLNKIFSEDLAL